ncbi:RNA cytosine C(5)-methyltransferase NSUN2-like [Schistocerca gregaria]|uniref:RNA cytosine C(5)-methyltransferase NSUN2-like n=1 Tax=Schistocerca gregaria TaxID=7010 RepID=UPI00211E98E2|nr:RNA cytosine C(5)-methyltransferase NSUN2-like [Schistocerca gregaria]
MGELAERGEEAEVNRKRFKKGEGVVESDGLKLPDDGRVTVSDKTNLLFEEYYRRVVGSSEFDEFLKVLRTNLACTFRVCRYRVDSERMIRRLVKLNGLAEGGEATEGDGMGRVNGVVGGGGDFFGERTESEANVFEEASSKFFPLVFPIPWFPSLLAWQVAVSRGDLSRESDSVCRDIHQFLVRYSNLGLITRQEVVSMIPPLFLDVRANSLVLDMCAAPGSKTVQLVEMLHEGSERSALEGRRGEGAGAGSRGVADGGGFGDCLVSGVVVANDVNAKRCHMLISQLVRLSSPAVLVVNCDAQKFPSLRGSSGSGRGVDLAGFDRVLCDVPCSGDGTLRKNADIWLSWNPGVGLSMHRTQCNILSRAVELASLGARIVYSTCSMNPVEDEAVVAAVLKKFGEESAFGLQILDTSQELPRLKRRPGLLSWTCMGRDGTWYSAHDQLPERLQLRIPLTVFPPDEETAKSYHLERCMRFLPHDQDTGGFFVAVIEKVSRSSPAESPEGLIAEAALTGGPSSECPLGLGGSNLDSGPPIAKRRELSFCSLLDSKHEELWKSISAFYQLKDLDLRGQLFCASEKASKLYFVSRMAGSYIRRCGDRLRIVRAGVRVMMYLTNAQGSPCQYRLVQEGIEAFFAVMGPERVVELQSVAELERLLSSSGETSFTEFSHLVREKLESIEVGGVVYKYDRPRSRGMPILAVGWRGKVSTHLLVNGEKRKDILRMVLEDE